MLKQTARQKLEGSWEGSVSAGDLGSTPKQSLGLNLAEVAQEKGRKAVGTAMPRQGEDSGAGPGNELCVGLMSWNG